MLSLTNKYEQTILAGISKVWCQPAIHLFRSDINRSGSSGGPAGAVYGFIFVWAGVAATFVVLSELASMYETILSWEKDSMITVP